MVRASDFGASIERTFRLNPTLAMHFLGSIEGAATCGRKPATCSLSKGIVADDAARTVTFQLSAPDPDFLFKLALPTAYALLAAGRAQGPEGPLPRQGPTRWLATTASTSWCSSATRASTSGRRSPSRTATPTGSSSSSESLRPAQVHGGREGDGGRRVDGVPPDKLADGGDPLPEPAPREPDAVDLLPLPEHAGLAVRRRPRPQGLERSNRPSRGRPPFRRRPSALGRPARCCPRTSGVRPLTARSAQGAGGVKARDLARATPPDRCARRARHSSDDLERTRCSRKVTARGSNRSSRASGSRPLKRGKPKSAYFPTISNSRNPSSDRLRTDGWRTTRRPPTSFPSSSLAGRSFPRIETIRM